MRDHYVKNEGEKSIHFKSDWNTFVLLFPWLWNLDIPNPKLFLILMIVSEVMTMHSAELT